MAQDDEQEVTNIGQLGPQDADYGPAPSLEDIRRGAYRPDYQKSGIKDTPIPSNVPLNFDVSPETAAQFGTPNAPKRAVDVLTNPQAMAEQTQPTDDLGMIQRPANEFENTPAGLMKELVVNRGKTYGESLDLVKDMYNKGNMYVRALPNIDEFVANMPGTMSLTKEKFLENVGEPAQFGMNLLSKLSKKVGGPDLPQGMTGDQIAQFDKFNEETRPKNLTSGILGAAPTMLPWSLVGGIAKGALMAENAGWLARMGARAVGTGAAVPLLDLMKGQTPTAGNIALNVIGAEVLHGASNVLGGTLGALFGRGKAAAPILDAMKPTEEPYNVPPNPFTEKFKQNPLYDYMKSIGANDQFLNGITDPQDLKQKAPDFFGKAIARQGTGTVSDYESLGGLLRGMGPDSYNEAVDAYQETMRGMGESVVPKPIAWEDLSKPYETASFRPKGGETHMVVGNPVENNGALKFYAPLSRFHLDNQGAAEVMPRSFPNPLSVDVGEGQMPAYAAITQMKGDPKLGAAVQSALDTTVNRWTNIPTSQVNQTIESVANRLAKKNGFGSIIYKGTTADKNIYVDLSNVPPLSQKPNELIQQAEANMRSAGRKYIRTNALLNSTLPLAGLAALGLTFNAKQTQAAPLNFEMLRGLIDNAGEAFGPWLGRNMGDLSKGENMALSYAGQKFGLDQPVEQVLNKLEATHELLKQPWEPEFRDNESPGAFLRGLRNISIVHPTVGEVGRIIYDKPDPGQPIGSMYVQGVGPGAVGPTIVKKTLNYLKTLPEWGGIEDTTRQTGAVEKTGNLYRKAIIAASIPAVGMGLGALSSDDKAQAMDWEPLIKAAGKFASVDEMADSLEPRLGALVKQAGFYSGESDPSKAMAFLGKVHDDIHDLSGGTNVDVFNNGPDYVAAHVTHNDLGPFPLAVVNGVVDPDSGTWYPKVSASPLGFNDNALQKVFEKVRAAQPLVQKLGNPLSLAGVLAATWAGKQVWDTVNGTPANAAEIPTGELLNLLSPGVRGAGEQVLEDVVRSVNPEDLLRGTMQSVGEAQANAAKIDPATVDIGEMAGQNYGNMGNLQPETNQMIGQLNRGENHNTFFSWRNPWSVSDHEAYQGLLRQDVKLSSDLVYGIRSTRNQSWEDLDKILADVKPEQGEEFLRAVKGWQPAANGWLQTATGISDPVDELSRQFKVNTVGKWDQMITGVDPRASAILQGLGLPEDARTYKLIKMIQDRDPEENLALPNGADSRHQAAAVQLNGMLNIQPWQWQNLKVPFAKRSFPITPLEQIKAGLEQRLSEMQALHGENPPADVQMQMSAISDRLNQIKQQEGQVVTASMDVLHRARFGPYEETTQPLEDLEESDPRTLLRGYIDGAAKKVRGDQMNYKAGLVTRQIEAEGDPALADYTRQYMNTTGGLKALRGDTRVVNFFNSVLSNFGNGKVTLSQYRKMGDMVTEAMWALKLGFGLRFPILHTVLPYQTAAFLGKYLFQAQAKILNNPAIWDEAMGQNILQGGVSYLDDLGANSDSFMRRILGYLPQKALNNARVMVYQAAKDYALDNMAAGTFKPQKFIRGFDKSILGSGTPEEIAKEYAAATTKVTQFMNTPQGRPLILSGGVGTRMLGQFKSFTANHFNLLLDMASHGKETGDWQPLIRSLVSTALLGGVGTYGGYDALRRYAIGKGYALPQPTAPIGYFLSTAASALFEPDTANELNQALQNIQLGGSFELHTPALNSKDLMEFLAGPTYGTVLRAGEEASQGNTQGVIGAISPTAASLMAASQMVGNPTLNDIYSKLGYRGESYSPTGKPLIQQPSMPTILSRALNWQPSLKSQRYKYVKNIQSALEGGQNGLAQTFLDQARNRGFIFTKQDFAGIKGAATREKSMQKPNEPLP